MTDLSYPTQSDSNNTTPTSKGECVCDCHPKKPPKPPRRRPHPPPPPPPPPPPHENDEIPTYDKKYFSLEDDDNSTCFNISMAIIISIVYEMLENSVIIPWKCSRTFLLSLLSVLDEYYQLRRSRRHYGDRRVSDRIRLQERHSDVSSQRNRVVGRRRLLTHTGLSGEQWHRRDTDRQTGRQIVLFINRLYYVTKRLTDRQTNVM